MFMVVMSAVGQVVLTNEAVVKMLKAGLGEEVVVSAINASPGSYSTSPDDLIALKGAGVPDKVITAMVSRGAASRATNTIVADDPLLVPDGTPVHLRLARNLSSADAKTGDTVDFEVLEDVKVDDTIVVARGAVAIATVTEAESKKRMARGGKLDVNIDYVRIVNGDKIALRAVKETKGGGHTGAMTGGIVATAIVFWPAAPFFLFMHGKDTTIPKGTEITAYVNGEIRLDRAKLLPKQSSLQSAAPQSEQQRLGPAAVRFDSPKMSNGEAGPVGSLSQTGPPVSASDSVQVNGAVLGGAPMVAQKKESPEPRLDLIIEHVIISASKPTHNAQVQGESLKSPQNGTEFARPISSSGSGTILISNELDSDAFIQLLRSDGKEIRAMYVVHQKQAAITAISSGMYMIKYTIGSGWSKGGFVNVAGSGKIGALTFMQIESADGVRANHYEFRLTS
jgi:hypothetical protein